MTRKHFILFTFIILGITQSSFSQNDNEHRTFSSTICEFNLPAGRSGLSVTSFLVTPRIRIDRGEKTAQIILDIDEEQGTTGQYGSNIDSSTGIAVGAETSAGLIFHVKGVELQGGVSLVNFKHPDFTFGIGFNFLR